MANKNFEVKHGLSVGGTERITSAGVGTFTDLNVTGTTTTIDTATLQVQDKNIVINYGSGDTSSTASGAGITIQDAVDASNDATLLWDASADEFDFSHTVTAPSLTIAGNAAFDTSTLVVDSTNNRVGIKAASPDSNLQIMNNDGSSYRFGYGGTSDVYFDADNVYFRTDNGGANTALLTPSQFLIGATSSSFSDSLYLSGSGYGVAGWRVGSTATYVGKIYNNSGKLSLETDSTRDIQFGSETNPDTMYIDTSDQLVGIGTTSPQKRLHISSSDNQPLRVESTDAYSGIELKDNGSSTYPPLISALSDDFIFYAGDSSSRGEVLRLASSGNIGIGGVTSPQSRIHTHIASSGGAYHQFTNSSTGSADGDGWKIGIHDDENLIIWGQESAESFRVYNNGAYRLTVDHNGAVDIPSANLYLTGSNDRRIKLSDSGISGISDSNNTVNIRGDNDYMKLNAAGNGGIIFEIEGTEAMRVTPNRNFTVANTANVGSWYNGTSGVGFGYSPDGYGAIVRSGLAQPWYVSTTSQGSGGFVEFSQNGAQRGVIQYNGSVMLYGGTSDYRLKENVTPMENALTKISALNPVNFDWIESGENSEGFLAHEIQEVLPYTVTGIKDDVYTDDNSGPEKVNGEPNYQNVDYGKLTPILVKAIQEQQIIIEDLKSRIETLEG